MTGVQTCALPIFAVKVGLTNINAYVLTVTYGFCFGVELTMTNVAALYFYTDHGLTPQLAGVFASLFGLMNLFARSTGGILSDVMNKKYGMRGRLWSMFIVQLIEGALCIIMGIITIGYDSPTTSDEKIMATFDHEDVRYNLCETHKDYMVTTCGTNSITTKDIPMICDMSGAVSAISASDLGKRILVGDNTSPDAGDCIRNNNLVGYVVIVMVVFSTCVQAAEGLHFGVVPYISRVALPVVSGMVGAGGNFGGVMGSRYIVSPYIPLRSKSVV